MRPDLNIYLCPFTRQPLQLKAETKKGEEIITGTLSCGEMSYPIEDGIPLFVKTDKLLQEQVETLNYYNDSADIYDDVIGLTFKLQYLDEVTTRKRFIEP